VRQPGLPRESADDETWAFDGLHCENRREKEESLHFVGIEPNKRVGEGD